MGGALLHLSPPTHHSKEEATPWPERQVSAKLPPIISQKEKAAAFHLHQLDNASSILETNIYIYIYMYIVLIFYCHICHVQARGGVSSVSLRLAAPIGRLRRPQVTTGASGPGNSDLFVKPSPPQIELPNLQPPPELPAPVISVPGTAPSPPTPPSPAAPAETPEPEMEPTGPSKDAPKPDQSEASLPSVPIAAILPSVPVPPQAVPQSTALDPEPLEPVRKGPRPLPQPKHPISKEAGRNGTFEKAMPPTVVEIADKEEKKERTEVMEEREERQEEEVDYDDDNDDNEDDNDGPDKAESEADEKVDSEPEIKDSPIASQQVIDELKTQDKMEAHLQLCIVYPAFTKQKLYKFVKLFSSHFVDLSYQPN